MLVYTVWLSFGIMSNMWNILHFYKVINYNINRYIMWFIYYMKGNNIITLFYIDIKFSTIGGKKISIDFKSTVVYTVL